MKPWSLLKSFMRRIFPHSFRLSVICPKMIRNRVINKTRMAIASGPFSGVHYLKNSVGSVLEPKLLGIYERELHVIIEELVDRKPATVIDIGAAEGYYAVGLAVRLPKSRIVAFEREVEGQQLLSHLAIKNNVAGRIEIFGACRTSELNRAINNGAETTIVCDVEGAESFLLDPMQVPALLLTSILVELHPKQCPGVKELIRGRFESSHKIRTIFQEQRSNSDFPFNGFPISIFPKVYIDNAVSEFRQPWEEDPMEWYWMVPR